MDDFLLALLISALAAIIIFISYSEGYEKGQIDALNNKVYYQIERQEDGSAEWKYCEEGCKTD